MAYGIQLFNDSGTIMWDSTTAPGGVIADILTYGASNSDTKTYPVFAGRGVLLVSVAEWANSDVPGVTADVALGYPRVSIATSSQTRKFLVVVF